jgi:hypothetical protein
MITVLDRKQKKKGYLQYVGVALSGYVMLCFSQTMLEMWANGDWTRKRKEPKLKNVVLEEDMREKKKRKRWGDLVIYKRKKQRMNARV